MKLIRDSVLILLACVLLGFLLLCLAYCIPGSLLEESGAESAYAFLPDRDNGRDPLSGRQIDRYSDPLILLEALYPGKENLIERVIASYFMATPLSPGTDFEKEGLLFFGEAPIGPDVSIVELYLEGVPGRSVSYSRYWHGYVVFLRPLLTLFNYNRVRLLYSGVMALLLLAILALLVKKLPRAAGPFALSALLLAPGAVGRCLHFTSMVMLMLLACFLLLWNPGGRLNRRNMPCFFLLVGIAASYLDLMTAPSITLTAPLCLLCAQAEGEEPRETLRTLFLCCLLWAAGYGGMWCAKWVLAWLWQGDAALRDAMGAVSSRASSSIMEDMRVTRPEALLRNVRMLLADRRADVSCLVYAIAAPLLLLAGRRRGLAMVRRSLPLLLVPCAVAVLWILALCNHSYIHCWFTYRTLVPCVLALLTALTPEKPGRKAFLPI